jgi:hypothetical protein
MTLTELILRARARSRTSSDFVSDADFQDRIEEAINAFGLDTKAFIKHTYLDISPLFWTSTDLAISLTITGGTNALAATDIAITSLARSRATGTQVASDLQTAIQAAGASTATVTWSTTEWKFTIDASDATSITVDSPDSILYVDATDTLFGTTGTQSDTSWESEIPTDCTIEADLPDDFLRIKDVEWDGCPLYLSTFNLFTSPQLSGTPSEYCVYNRRIRISPAPASQKRFSLWYYYSPALITSVSGYQECGLSGISGSSATGLSTATDYYFKVTIDGGTETEYDITTGTTLTFTAVIALMNAEVSGATFSVYDGDLRCTSDSSGVNSTIALAAGSSGDDLFAALTGFSAFDAAYSVAGADIEIDDEAEDALLYYVAAVMAEEESNQKHAMYLHARYDQRKKQYMRLVQGRNTKYRTSAALRRANYEVVL